MYESKQMPWKERAGNARQNSAGENRTGIPAAMKAQYEAASGLSFDDVRIHYNSPKPDKLQALAYTQGNHVYIAPGQERHLRHELGHVIQQKRGMVHPTKWMNGLPVNDDRGLEQQAEKGLIPTYKESNGYGSARPAGNNGNAAPEERMIQGVFLQWVTGEDGQSYLVESREGEHSHHDTASMWVGEIFNLLENIKDADLIGRLSREICDKLPSVSRKEEILDIINSLFSFEEEIDERIVSALNSNCCNWLWHVAKKLQEQARQFPSRFTEKDISRVQSVQEFVERRFSVSEEDRTGAMEDGRLGADVTDAQRYGEVLWKINKLHIMINQVNEMPHSDKKNQLIQLIRYDILGYMRLQKRFEKDFMMKKMPLEELQQHFRDAFGGGNPFPDEMTASVESAVDRNGFPVMYAVEKSQQVPLPVLGELPGVIRNGEAVRRDSPKVNGSLAQDILREVQRADSGERLVIFRGMNGEEALSILQIFNSSGAAALEAAVWGHCERHPFDVHDKRNRANLGKHYGEYAQAEEYKDIRGGNANVLLAFILKPGAKELLFSKSLLALHGENLRRGHGYFAEASEDEGTAPGYIGVKAEQARGSHTYSLGVAQPATADNRTSSQLLLQLLIDRVEVRRILF